MERTSGRLDHISDTLRVYDVAELVDLGDDLKRAIERTEDQTQAEALAEVMERVLAELAWRTKP